MPGDWNSSLIYSIFKKGHTSASKNYRGNMLIQVIHKILSKIILNKVNKFAANILEDCQHGFR